MTEIGYSRHRKRGMDYEIVPITLHGTRPLYPNIDVTEERCLFQRVEEIWDNPGSKKDFHDCKHIMIDCKPSRNLTSWHLDVSNLPGAYPNWSCRPFWVPRAAFLVHKNSVTSWLNSDQYDIGTGRWREFTSRAFDSITEQVPTVIDVPNLLRDIFTLKGLVRQCANLCSKLWGLLKAVGAFARQHYVQTLSLRKLLKNVADGYLIHQFGIKPFIREIEQLMGGTAAILKRLDFLRRTQGSVFPARYTESVEFTKPDQQLALADAYGFSNSTIWLRSVQGVVKYACTAKVKNNLVGLDDFLAGIKIYLAALGGQDVVKFLWDLVPFSFVIDWNYNVSGLLDRYASVQPFSGSLEVVSAGTSFKKMCTGTLRIEGPAMTYEGYLDYATLHYKEYQRHAGLDIGFNYIKPFSALTPHQLGVLSALVIQRTGG